MKARIIVAVIFLPIVFVILFFLPPIFLAMLIAIICAGSAWELMRAVGGTRNREIGLCVAASPLILFAIYFATIFSYLQAFQFVAAYLMIVMFVDAFRAYESHNSGNTKRQISFLHILTALFVGVILPMMLVPLLILRDMPAGRYLVFIPIICAFLTDAGAYFSGYFFGKKKAFPKISPKKTIAGCIGGLFTGSLMLFLFGLIVRSAAEYDVNLWLLIILGFVGSAVTQIGDLAFSLVKREFDVKDYGKLLPGHGGMLDRFDSLFFAAPVMYLMIVAFGGVIA